MGDNDVEISIYRGGCVGCVTVIVAVFALWALVFGITYDGRHYGLNCSCDQGVSIENESVGAAPDASGMEE